MNNRLMNLSNEDIQKTPRASVGSALVLSLSAIHTIAGGLPSHSLTSFAILRSLRPHACFLLYFIPPLPPWSCFRSTPQS